VAFTITTVWKCLRLREELHSRFKVIFVNKVNIFTTSTKKQKCLLFIDLNKLYPAEKYRVGLSGHAVLKQK